LFVLVEEDYGVLVAAISTHREREANALHLSEGFDVQA
jgi:hypothetical protein